MSKIFRNKAAGTQFNLKSKKIQASEFKSFFKEAVCSTVVSRKVKMVRIVKPLGKKAKRIKEAKALAKAKEEAKTIAPLATNRFTKLNQAVSVVYPLGCVLMNFNKDVTIEDAEAWYDETRKETDVIVLNINANSKRILNALLEAANGKGEYAGSTVVVSCNGKFKRPKKAFDIEVTNADFESKRSEYQDVIDFGAFVDELGETVKKQCGVDIQKAYRQHKTLGNLDANKEKIFVDALVKEAQKTIDKDDAALKLAEKDRLHAHNRRRIYNTATGEFGAYTMFLDRRSGEWHFVRDTQKPALSELLRAIIKEYDLGYVMTRNLVKHYRIDTMFQLNFQGNFIEAKHFKHVFKTPDGKLYVHCISAESDNEDGGEKESFKEYRCLTEYSTIDTLPAGTETYINVAHGASGIRKNSSIYLLDDGKIESILDRASRGIYGCHKGALVNNSEIVKINTRIMASAAPSQILYNIDAFAIYVDKFGIGDKDSHIEKFKGLKGTLDGIAFTLFNAMQARLGSSKIFASQVTKRLMQMMIRFFDANPIVLEVGDVQTEEQKAIIAAAFNKKDNTVMINGELVDLKGRIIICKKKGSQTVTPEYFSDLNGFKTAFDITRGFEIPVLDLPIPNNAHSSTQFLSKLIAAGGLKAVDLITNRMKAHFDDLLSNFHKDSEIRIKDLKDPYMKGIIGKACPEYMKLDFSLTRQNVGLMLNAMAKSLNRMRFPIVESANGRALPDIGALFGMPILKDEEVYTIDIKSETDMIVIKYPTIGEREFWKAKCLSYKEACNRINGFAIPESLKGFGNDFRSELKNYFRTMEAGAAMMPANKALMHGLAGMDFDYDMVIMIHDKEFVAFFKDIKPGVIHIMNDADDDSAIQEFNYRVMSDSQLSLIAKTAANVGGVTNNYNIPLQFDLLCKYCIEKTNAMHTQRLDAMLALNTKEAEKLARQVEKRKAAEQSFVSTFAMLIDYSIMDANEATQILKKRKRTEMGAYDFNGAPANIKNIQIGLAKRSNRTTGPAYQPIGENYDDPLYVYLPVSKAQKEHAEEQLKTCRITTLEDIRIICADINRIARSDQETTIDSAKTSIVARIVLNFSMFFNVFSKVEYEYEIHRADISEDGEEDTNENRIIRYVKTPNGDRGDLGKKYYIYDVFAIIRDDVEKYIIPKVQLLIDESLSTADALTDNLESYVSAQNLPVCMDVANLYGSLARSNAKNPGKMEKTVTQSIYMAMQNMVKMAVDGSVINKSGNSLGAFVTWLSCYTRSGGQFKKKISKTGFNTAVFPIETMFFAYKLTGKRARVCEPITYIEGGFEEDSTVEFVNGNVYDENGRLVIVAKEFLNGKFKLSTVNNKLMACNGVSNYVDRNNYPKDYITFSVKGAHKDIAGEITFDAYQRGAYSSRDNAKVVIDGTIYDSHMYSAIKFIKDLGVKLNVAYSTPISDDCTIIVAHMGDVVTEEVLEDNIVQGYVPDAQFEYSVEEAAAIASFNVMDYGYENADFTMPNFDEGEPAEFEEF